MRKEEQKLKEEGREGRKKKKGRRGGFMSHVLQLKVSSVNTTSLIFKFVLRCNFI